ncbi:MAG: hypothetical protein AB7N71_13960 [Phycisphaerae bacterium]
MRRRYYVVVAILLMTAPPVHAFAGLSLARSLSLAPAVEFASLYEMPIGRRGLEYTAALRALEGKTVRMTGYLVAQCAPVAGQRLLSPIPVQLHEHEYNFAEDLPPTVVAVCWDSSDGRAVAHRPGPITVFGRLKLGTHEGPDGRVSAIRIVAATPTTLSRSDTSVTPVAAGLVEQRAPSCNGHAH